jgi:hypothetical protein
VCVMCCERARAGLCYGCGQKPAVVLGGQFATGGRGHFAQTCSTVGLLLLRCAYNLLALLLPPCCCCCVRPDYMNTFVEKLIDWDSVGKRFEAATA